MKIQDDIWFKQQQSLLLWLVNTPDGRDLLQIPRDFPRIFRIDKNSCTALADIKDNQIIKVSRFHPGRVYAKLINNRWQEFQELASWYYDSLPSFSLIKFPVAPIHGLRFTTSTFEPSAGNAGGNPVDGNINKADSSSWSTTRDATTGQAALPTNDNGWCGTDFSGGNYTCHRDVNCYGTSSIPDGDTISSATIAMKKNVAGGDVDNDYLVMCQYTGDTTNITTAEYDSITGMTGAMTQGSDQLDITGIGTTATWTLDATGRGWISKTGNSGFVAVGGRDATGNGGANAPTGANAINFFMADHASEPAPLLTVTHAAAVATVKAINNLLTLGVG